jgi:ribosome-binding protein aMBF1 (putative translation factor)
MVLLDTSHSESTHEQTQHGTTRHEQPQHEQPRASPDQQDRRSDVTQVVATEPLSPTSDARGAVGRLLRSARESRDWDIDELVRRTSLSPRILRGMEAGDFSASRGDCYARGHLRILARALSIDEARLLAAVPATDPLAEDDTAPPVPERPAHPLRLLVLAAVLLAAIVAVLLIRSVA